MKTSAAKKGASPAKKSAGSSDAIGAYGAGQSPEFSAICQVLRTEIEAALPKATSKIWHGSPVWFVGECPVTGYNITAKNGINLLFWNGQAFEEPALKPMGKFKAAQIQYTVASAVDRKALRRWLKKAGSMLWDITEVRRGR